MTLEVYLRSFGPAGADAEPLLIALGAEQDGLGSWQVDLGDGAAAEVSGLGAAGGRAGLVRLSGHTRRGADLLYALARSGNCAMVLPDTEAAGGARVFLPAGFDRALLPEAAPFDAAQSVESQSALYALLSDLLGKNRPEAGNAADTAPPPPAALGWLRRLIGRSAKG